MSIPGPSAVNLGSQSVDPVQAAVALLEAQARDAAAGRRQAYWRLLPPPDAADLCTPDFFSGSTLTLTLTLTITLTLTLNPHPNHDPHPHPHPDTKPNLCTPDVFSDEELEMLQCP